MYQQRDVTFFMRDLDFYRRDLRHSRYGLVFLAIGKDEVAAFVRRVLRHPELNTKAKRMGTGMRVSRVGLTMWQPTAEKEIQVEW